MEIRFPVKNNSIHGIKQMVHQKDMERIIINYRFVSEDLFSYSPFPLSSKDK